MHTLEPTTTADPAPKRRRRIAGAVALGVAMLAAAAVSGSADAASGRTGVHYRSSATCNGISSPVVAAQSRVRVAAPTIYAANTTPGIDGQFVSFRQRLLKWSGSGWVPTNQHSAVWRGFATDAGPALDFLSGSQTVRRPAFNFTTGPRYFAVVTDYWWPNGSDSATAYHSPSTSSGYCAFQF